MTALNDEREILNIDIEKGHQLIVEAIWTGIMAMDAAHLKKGQNLKAHLCMIIEFKDEKIFRQRNQDLLRAI